jgi:Uma2 family endonuclease
MTTPSKKLSLEEYFAYDNRTDRRYELQNGELVEIPPESDRNHLIAMYLISLLLQVVPIQRLRRGTEIVVNSTQSTTRVPDLLVLTDALSNALVGASRSTILPEMPPPALVVEVVSPGKENEDRDYRCKRSEYAARGIDEYWIVDPLKEQVTVLTLVDGQYEEKCFRNNEPIVSTLFPHLMPTAAEILTGGDQSI